MQMLRLLSGWSLASLVVASALGVACESSQGPPGTTDSGAPDSAPSGDSAPPQDAGGPCATNADCPGGGTCGFPSASGCAAKGTCFPGPGAVCQAYSAGCACDGSEINVACTGLPAGYFSKPLLHTGACAADSGTDAAALQWYGTCGDPVCHSSTDAGPTDAGLTDDAGAPCPAVGSACATSGQTCGTHDPNVQCGATEVCSDHDPKLGPGGCPISTRKLKSGIEYVDGAELERLHDEVLKIRLATFTYKPEVGDGNRKHLGFIVEDAPGSPAVDTARERVDLYGYVSMALAAMQVQDKQIAELRRKLDDVRRGKCEAPRR